MSWDSEKRGYLKLECGDGTTLSDWGEEGIGIRSAVLTRQLSEGEGLTIGAVCPAEVTLTMAQALESGTSFLLSLGQEEEGAVSWQALGQFTVRGCTKENTFYTVEASDALAGLEEEFSGQDGGTLAEVLAALCEQAGLTLGETELPELTLPALPEGLTLRLLLGYLAALWGGNALLDEEGKLVFRWFSDRCGEASAGDSYEGCWSVKTDSRTVEALSFTVTAETDDGLSSSDTVERSTGSSGVTLTAENPLVTEDNIDIAWQRVQAFTYSMGELTLPGLPEVTAGDCLSVTEEDGTEHNLPIVLHKLEYDGGLKSTLTSPTQTEEEEETVHQGSVGRQLSTLSAELGQFESVYTDYIEAAEGRFTTLETEKLKAERIDLDDLFAQDITATGTITGGTITGATIKGNTITGGTISGATVKGNTITGGTISGATIKGNTITGGTISGTTISGVTMKASELLYESDGETAGRIYFDNGLTIEAGAGLPLYYTASRGHNFSGPIYAGSLISAEGSLSVGGELSASGGIHLANNKILYGTNTSGTEVENITPCNSNNNCVIGYGSYAIGEGSTNIYGQKLSFIVGEASNAAFTPYYCAGDSFEVDFLGAGFITGSGKVVCFSVPIDRPIIGSPTVKVTNVTGLCIRQNGKYCYGSGAEVYVSASSFTAARWNGLIRVRATMSGTTNVTNNDACGVDASIKITFS